MASIYHNQTTEEVLSTIRLEAVAVGAKIVSVAVAIAALKISTIFTTRTYTIMDRLQNDAGVEGEWIRARRIDLVSCYCHCRCKHHISDYLNSYQLL